MAINYPTGLDTFTNPSSTSPRNNPSLASQQSDQNDAIEALERKVGITSSSDSNTLDYKLTNTNSSNPGHKHTLASGATDVTASATEINILDGAVISTTELNYLDGVTSNIQTQIDGVSAGGVSDGDKGDITVSSTGTVWTIDNDAVTYAKIQNVSSTDKILGRISTGSGNVEEITCTDFAQSLLDDIDNTTARSTLGLGTAATQNIASASGAWDFGGATSVEIPNGAGGTTVNTTGELCIDSTSKTLNFYDGSNEVVLNPISSKSVIIESPTSSDDFALWRSDVAITLTKVSYLAIGGTSWTGQIQECDGNGINGADVHTSDITASAGTTTTSTTFSNTSIDAGDWVGVKTTSVSGSVTRVHITFYFRENA